MISVLSAAAETTDKATHLSYSPGDADPDICWHGHLELNDQRKAGGFGKGNVKVHATPCGNLSGETDTMLPDKMEIWDVVPRYYQHKNYVGYIGGPHGWCNTSAVPLAVHPVRDQTTNAKKFNAFVGMMLDREVMAISGELLRRCLLIPRADEHGQHLILSLIVIRFPDDSIVNMMRIIGEKDHEMRRLEEKLDFNAAGLTADTSGDKEVRLVS